MADDEGRRRSPSSRPISTIVFVIGLLSVVPNSHCVFKLVLASILLQSCLLSHGFSYGISASIPLHDLPAAMEDEALPIIRRFDLLKDTSIFPEGVPWIRYHGSYNNLQLNVIWPGKDPVLGVNNVGTVPAALTTYASVQALKPDLIINTGTAGGFTSKGAQTGDVFLVSSVAFHHRRNPLPVRDLYCIGLRRAFSTPALSSSLQAGVLSTGDSFDMCERDQALAEANDATIVDMEGAAVAYVASLLSVPVIFLKVVSNSVNGGRPSLEEFQSNLASVTTILGETVGQVVDFICGKHLHEL